MDPVPPMFPLFKMPYLVWKHILRTMEPFDLIKSTLCSRNIKRKIRSLFPHSTTLGIELSEDRFCLSLLAFGSYEVALDHADFTLQGISTLDTTEQSLYESSDPEPPEEHISHESFDVKAWIRHFTEAFHCDGVHLDFACDEFDFRGVQRVIEGLTVHGLSMMDAIPNDYLLMVLEAIRPTKKLHLNERPDPYPFEVFTRNYDEMELDFLVDLEEILSFNSKSIKVDAMIDTDFNNLLKRWVEGWNPQLKELFLDVRTTEDDYLLVLFDGLTYEEGDNNSRDADSRKTYVIKRTNGTTATVSCRKTQDDVISVRVTVLED